MRFIVTLLVSLLSLQSLGPYALFQVQQQQLKRQMKRAIKAGVPDAELHRIAFAASRHLRDSERVQWMHEREFRLDGEMYDIVRSEQRGDSIIHHCIRDDEETALFARLDALVREESGSNPAERGKSASLQRLASLLYLPTEACVTHTPMQLSCAATQPAPAPLHADLRPPDPPPRSIS